MRRDLGGGKLQFRPSMARYTVAAMIRVGIWARFWLAIWLIFGATPLNILIFVAVLLALFVLSFVQPFLMLIDVRYGHIEGPDGFGSSAIDLEDVDWARSTADPLLLDIRANDGRAVFADRSHFSAEELEEIYLTFTGGNSGQSDSENEETDFSEADVAADC